MISSVNPFGGLSLVVPASVLPIVVIAKLDALISNVWPAVSIPGLATFVTAS